MHPEPSTSLKQGVRPLRLALCRGAVGYIPKSQFPSDSDFPSRRLFLTREAVAPIQFSTTKPQQPIGNNYWMDRASKQSEDPHASFCRNKPAAAASAPIREKLK